MKNAPNEQKRQQKQNFRRIAFSSRKAMAVLHSRFLANFKVLYFLVLILFSPVDLNLSRVV